MAGSQAPLGIVDYHVSTATVVARGDGSFAVSLDSIPPFELPPVPGRLFQLLAEDAGHEIGDGRVGFKSNGYLMSKLNEFACLRRNASNGEQPRRDPLLTPALADLRSRLNRLVPNGDRLVQTRRYVGFRIVVDKPRPATGSTAPSHRRRHPDR